LNLEKPVVSKHVDDFDNLFEKIEEIKFKKDPIKLSCNKNCTNQLNI
jgi:hypothetical protein